MTIRIARPVLLAAALSLVGFAGIQPAQGQFTGDNVSLYAFLDFQDLGGGDNGNDCWGYTSPSGREYALMGVSNKMVVVEITDPANPVVIGNVPHSNSLWGDIKTYQDYAYVVNESGGGIDVVDLSDVDNGNVVYLQSVTTNGLQSSHNVLVDEDSGYLYLAGANIHGGRLTAYSLANPANPVEVGSVNSVEGAYVHDAEVYTYTSGPYAGKQIAFCANGGVGLDIYDVTNKNNMPRLSRTTYANLSYAHQCWLSEDSQYLYMNDELDGVNETVVIDVSNLSAPVVVDVYDSGVLATDHNGYVSGSFVFEADYRAGMRVFCNEDPVNPVQVGWFDTFPEDNATGFDGAWSLYPYFPSGTAIISDITRGLFIVDPSEALVAGSVAFSYPDERPVLLNPQGGTTVTLEVEGSCGIATAADTGMLHYDVGNGLESAVMDMVHPDVYVGAFPASDCPLEVSYYFTVETSEGVVVTDPSDAPATMYTALAAMGSEVYLTEDFEVDNDWVAENLGASSGDWQRGVPIDDDNWDFDPSSDGDGSGQCWLTENFNNPDYVDPSNTDVDAGAVRLTSPILDMSGENTTITYEYFLRLTNDGGGIDKLLVEISSTGDAGPWTTIAAHTTNGADWRHHEILPSELADAGVTLTSTMKVRFTANDDDPQSIVEAGIDGFTLSQVICEEGVFADLDGDGSVGAEDLAVLLGSWGACPGCPADLDGDGLVNAADLALLLGSWG